MNGLPTGAICLARSPIASRRVCQFNSTLHASYRVDRVFHLLGIGGPEAREVWLVHVSELLAELVERAQELRAVRSCIDRPAQLGDDGAGCTLGRKQADPKIVLQIIALLFEGWHLGQRLWSHGTGNCQGPYLAALDVWDCN